MSNPLDYPYLNPIPGSVAPNSSAVGQSTETTHQGGNPAYATAYEQVHGQGQQGSDAGNQDSEGRTPAGADDLSNPAGADDLRDQGPAPTRP